MSLQVILRQASPVFTEPALMKMGGQARLSRCIPLSPRRERVRVRGEFDFYFVIFNIITKAGK